MGKKSKNHVIFRDGHKEKILYSERAYCGEIFVTKSGVYFGCNYGFYKLSIADVDMLYKQSLDPSVFLEVKFPMQLM